MISQHLQTKLDLLPDKPGCYIMKDDQGNILYVGKAKVLKNRVRSYFHGVHDTKTTRLVSNIRDFEYIVTSSEKEALLLEINLIKKHRPPFNIMFMDDKSYPYIEVTGDQAVAVRTTRRPVSKRSHYFGPYPNASSASEMVRLIHQIFPIRKCRTLPKTPCLYYHMHQCLAPCIHTITKEENDQLRQRILKFLKGDTGHILEDLEKRRDQASQDLQFEKAADIQKTIESLQHVMEKQTIDFADKTSRDVFGWYEDKGYISFYGLMLRQGKLLERTLSIAPIYEDTQEAFAAFVLQYYQNNVQPKEILLPEGTETETLQQALQAKIVIPQKGDKKKLVDLAVKNARESHEQKFSYILKKDQELEAACRQLDQIFAKPVHTVELFDNSHLSGTSNVSGLVVFKDGSPDKSQYRHYRLDTYKSDLDSMKEVIYRRYFRLLKEGKPMPDLLLVDGGKQQIDAARHVKDELMLDLTIAGLVKDDRHSTRALMDEDGFEIALDRESQLFFLLTRMQDEVHRFAIGYHQKLRNKAMTRSILDGVPGIGPARKEKLHKHFKSMKKIREASIDQLAEIIGPQPARTLYAHLHDQETTGYNGDNDTETE